MGVFEWLFNNDKYYDIDTYKYPNVKSMVTKILQGPYAKRGGKIASYDFEDSTYYSDYEDEFFHITTYSGSGIGIGHISGSTNIYLKNGKCVYSDGKARDCHLWYKHLLDVYNKSEEKRLRIDNLNHKIKKLFDYVPSGYDNGTIRVYYEKKTGERYSSIENEYISYTDYPSCSIYLIPMGEYVYVENGGNPVVKREGKWVDYVCSLIDAYEAEEKKKYEEIARKRERERLQKQAKLKERENKKPIDDSHIWYGF